MVISRYLSCGDFGDWYLSHLSHTEADNNIFINRHHSPQFHASFAVMDEVLGERA